MVIVGLTGSIAMGKSETAKMFRQRGIPVFDADAEVHAMYAIGGDAVAPVSARFPSAVVNGAIDRSALAVRVIGDAAAMKDLEAIVHPLIRKRQGDFLKAAELAGETLVVIDHPLLLETGRKAEVDMVVVVSAPAELQRERALQRPGMTVEKLEALLARQMPDAEKRKLADFIVDSSRGLDDARRQVDEILRVLKGRAGKKGNA